MRVVSEVISERPFHAPLLRRHFPFQNELRHRRHRERHGARAREREWRAAQVGGECELIDIFRQGRDRRDHEDGIASQDDAYGKRFPARLRDVIVEAAPLLDLHVHPGGLRIEHVHPVGAEIASSRVRMSSRDHRPGHEGSAIERPGMENRHSREIRFRRFLHGSSARDSNPRAGSSSQERTLFPERRGTGRLE